MSEASASTFSSDFKRFFLRGLVILLPSVLTLWIVVKAYQFVDSTIAEPINRGVRLAIINVAPYWSPIRDQFDPTTEELEVARQAAGPRVPPDDVLIARLRADNIHEWWADHWYMDLLGLIVAIVAVYVAGRLLGGFLGKRLYRHVERFITSLPVFKQVYPYVKQIVDFLFSDEKAIQFNRVVVVEYPRKGIWSVGFQTGGTMRGIQDHAGEAVTVFIPSSPTPFTGYTITVPRDEVLELPITVEEAIRFIVSGGVLVPTDQQTEEVGPTETPRLTAAAKLAGKLVSSTASENVEPAPKEPVRAPSVEPPTTVRPKLAPDA